MFLTRGTPKEGPPSYTKPHQLRDEAYQTCKIQTSVAITIEVCFYLHAITNITNTTLFAEGSRHTLEGGQTDPHSNFEDPCLFLHFRDSFPTN